MAATQPEIASEPADRDATAPSFFRRLDWSAFWTATIVSLIVYCYTLAPTVSLEDSGELATASAYLGVPHPPGYPGWTIITWIFTKIFSFVTFRGQPNPAFGVNLVSAVFGALASGITAILICRSGTDMLRGVKSTTLIIGQKMEDAISWAGGVAGSLIFAFSSVNWSQAVIAEVYSLNAFFLALVLFLTYVWMRQPREKLTWLTALVVGIGLVSFAAMVGVTVVHVRVFDDFSKVGVHYVVGMALLAVLIAAMTYVWKVRPVDRLLYLTAFAFGMGLTNYQVLLLLIVSLAMVVFLKDLRLFRDFLVAGLPFLIVYLLSLKGFVTNDNVAGLRPEIPKTYASGYFLAVLYTLAAGAAIYVLSLFRGERRFRLLRQYLLISIPYACLLLFVWRHSLVDVTDIKNVRSVLPPIAHPASIVCYAYIFANCAGLALMYFLLPNGKTVAPAILCLELGLAIYAFMPLASETNPPMNWAFPRTWEGFKHAITRGQYERITPTPIFSREFVQQVGDYLEDLRITFTLPLAVLGFLPFTAWRLKLGSYSVRAVFVATVMAAVAVGFIALEEFVAPATGEILAFTFVYRTIIAGILLLMAAGGVVMLLLEAWDFCVRFFRDRPDSTYEAHEDAAISMDVDGISRKWTMVTLSGFAVMSLILIMLASPKGDIQDMFIQRVKFISSHALFALWVGYGLIFALASVGCMLKGNRPLLWAGTVVAVLLPLEPLRQNAYNPHLLQAYGGAEQNGHDFGWQFGNYQLRGAEAVHEELEADEEPLPNPCFPAEMGTNAVFFGGTDPGRFVPTYMIYGARVREDVYLITQNALADNTYMNVMRDLYGDQIWIPAQRDSARAFERYVREVDSGLRQRNAQITIENGRVQISGALGVMEINGILAQMIFENNNFRHDFYVEESYVIPWMYPYLTPHGLIMKINARQTPLTEEMNRSDMDFWDWYARRLDRSDKFTRDVVARKSFSKLRSAIGGLYRSRGDFDRAELAFQQARVLYPLSPEANFRLAQEVLIPLRRYAESRDIMVQFARQDPGNSRVPEFIRQIEQLDKMQQRLDALEKEMATGALDANKAIELATIYQQIGQTAKFNAVAASIVRNTNLPAVYHYQAAQLYAKNRNMAEMVKALDLCLAHMPTNAPATFYLDIAELYAKDGRMDRMLRSMQEYVRRKPGDWRGWLDVAAMLIGSKRNNEAVKALDQAARHGGVEAMETIRRDGRFAPLLKNMLQRDSALGLPGLPPPPGSPFNAP